MVQMALRTKLDRARSYWRALLAAEGSLWMLAALVAAFTLCFHLDRLLVLSKDARAGAWAMLGILASGFLIFAVLRPLLQPRRAEDVAVMVERRYPELRERLLSAVEFAYLPQERLAGVSSALLDDLQADAQRHAGGLNFLRAFRLRGVMHASTGFGLALLFLGLHLLFAGPAFHRFVDRMWMSNLPVWRDTRIQVWPPAGKVLKGTTFRVTATQEGRRADRGTLHFRFGDGRWNQVEVRAARDGDFVREFPSMTESMTYYALAGDGRSDQGKVEVVDPAAIVSAKLTLNYPAYMDKPPAVVNAAGGGVAAPVGTDVRLELQANKPLALAEATLPKAAAVSWPVRDRIIDGALVVRGNGQYSLRLKDQDGFFAPEAQTFPIKAIPDQTPEVQLLDPTGDINVAPDAHVPLSITARDDNGIDKVRVAYQVESRAPASLDAGSGGRRMKTLELESVWDLSFLKVKPGETIHYHVEATDFDTISGPHVGKTADLQLHVKDRVELQAEYDQTRAEIEGQIRELIKDQEGAKKDVDTQRAAAKPNAEAVAGAEERQRNDAATASDIARRISELRRMAQTNNLASKQDTDSQQSAQKGMDALSREAMPQAANKIGSAQAQTQSNPQGARSDLSSASQQQQQILQELKKIADQMKPASELERMAQRFEQLAKEQRKAQAQTDRMLPQTLGKSMNELTPEQKKQLGSLAQQQQNLQHATSQAIGELQKSAQSMQGNKPEQSQAAQETAESLRQGQVTEQQQQASQNTQQNSLGQARSEQERAAQKLEEAARNLRDALNPNDPRQLKRQLQEAMRRLNRMVQQQQEALSRNSPSMSAQERQELAKEQKRQEEQTRELARQLERLQRRTPSAGKASQNLSQAGQNQAQASQQIQQGQNSQSSQQNGKQQQQKAIQQMQQAMQSLQQAMAEASQDEDPFAELARKLNKLATRQKAIRDATRRIDEEAAGKAPPPGGHPEENAALKKLSQQQSDLESEAGKLEPDLPGDVFKAISRQARDAMNRSKDGLQAGNPKANPTGRAQATAQSRLEQLAKAFDDSDDPTKKGEGGGGGGGGGGGKPDLELLKRIAEVRLLRSMERGIRSQTQSVDDSRTEGTPLTEEQKSQVDEATRQQQAAKELAGRVVQGLQRYRTLQGKVSQAGKHMGEAHRGLSRGNTGDPVQEEETQAIVKLNDSLTRMQQQAQSQSQSKQNRQSSSQQNQPMAGQPQSGQPQNQGSSPAMRSYTRRTGLSENPGDRLGLEGRGFAGLEPREQDALRQFGKEPKPAEYQDLINRYYSALSDKSRKR